MIHFHELFGFILSHQIYTKGMKIKSESPVPYRLFPSFFQFKINLHLLARVQIYVLGTSNMRKEFTSCSIKLHFNEVRILSL